MFRRNRAPVFLTVVLAVITSPASAQEVPADFVITLERTAQTCGSDDCPDYSVSIDAQGNVTFEGKENVRVIGRVPDRIPTARVREVFATVERIGFFKLLDHYREIRIADSPRNRRGSQSLHNEANTQPLTVVRSAAAARALIEAGADPLARGEHGGTPMWWAPRSPPEIADVLLKAGVPADYHIALEQALAKKRR